MGRLFLWNHGKTSIMGLGPSLDYGNGCMAIRPQRSNQEQDRLPAPRPQPHWKGLERKRSIQHHAKAHEIHENSGHVPEGAVPNKRTSGNLRGKHSLGGSRILAASESDPPVHGKTAGRISGTLRRPRTPQSFFWSNQCPSVFQRRRLGRNHVANKHHQGLRHRLVAVDTSGKRGQGTHQGNASVRC